MERKQMINVCKMESKHKNQCTTSNEERQCFQCKEQVSDRILSLDDGDKKELIWLKWRVAICEISHHRENEEEDQNIKDLDR